MNWKNLRLDADLMTLLQRYRTQLESAVAKRPDRYPVTIRDKRLSLGDVIRFLLEAKMKHNERSKRCYTRHKDMPGQKLLPFAEQSAVRQNGGSLSLLTEPESDRPGEEE